MDIFIIEGVIFLAAGRNAARLAVLRQREDVQVGEVRGGGGLRRLMVAQRRPEEEVAQRRRIHVEDGGLMFRIGAAVVGVVAQHHDEVRRSVRGRKGVE